MFWLRVRHLIYNLTNFPSLLIIFLSVFHRTWLGLPHPSIVAILWCICTHLVDLMGIHFLHCVHGNEHMGTYDVVHDTFVTIVQRVSFHMGWEQLHVFLLIMFNSSCWRVDIVLTKNGIHSLANVVIVDPTRANLFFQSCATEGFISLDVTHVKKKNYCNWHPTD
jgi:hypothetical protein